MVPPQLSSPEVTQGLTLHCVIHGKIPCLTNLYQLANGVDGDLCNWFWESLSISRNRTCFRNLWSQLLIAHFLQYFLGNVPNLLSIAKFFRLGSSTTKNIDKLLEPKCDTCWKRLSAAIAVGFAHQALVEMQEWRSSKNLTPQNWSCRCQVWQFFFMLMFMTAEIFCVRHLTFSSVVWSICRSPSGWSKSRPPVQPPVTFWWIPIDFSFISTIQIIPNPSSIFNLGNLVGWLRNPAPPNRWLKLLWIMG